MVATPRTTALAPQLALLAAGLVAIHAAVFWILRGGVAEVGADAALAASLADLTLTTGALAWWTLVRPGHASWRAVAILVALNLLLGRALMPAEMSGGLLWAFAVVAVLAEGVVSFTALVRLRRVLGAWRAERQRGLAAIPALREALASVLPRPLAVAAATELGLLWLGVVGPFRRTPRADGISTFATYRATPWRAIVGVALFLMLVEGAAVHLLLRGLSELAMWAHAVLAVYGSVWLLGDAQGMRLVPLRLDEQWLHIDVGLRWSTRVALADLRDAAVLVRVDDATLDLRPMHGDGVLLELAEPVDVVGPFGVRKSAARLAVPCEDPAALVRALRRQIEA
ncbi:MAG: hypothetical protein H6747_10745 [Deltaproteobacteria bacterium]|nr:hypothetical protein [Deltaproteobacteria bacterium]